MIRVLIVGAGDAGKMLLKEFQRAPAISESFLVVGFLDDDRNKSSIDGVPVLGELKDVHSIALYHSIDQLIFAIPSAESSVLEKILDNLGDLKIKIKIVPGLYEIINGTVGLSNVRDIEPSDLLGREEVGFDVESIAHFYNDKRILVTGAGGSIGSEIVRQLLSLPISKVLAIGKGENSIHELKVSTADDIQLEIMVADVRDSSKILNLVQTFKPNIVFHAAAHKHVYLMEDAPDEAIKNNVFGTLNCANAAIQSGVERFVLVSTDKAVNPTSIMGASKRIAEKLVLSLNHTQSNTKFVLTRFGNVLGSRGSVVPKMQAQIKRGGPVTVTHPDVTRYFMSIREAARLVIKSASIEEGEAFVLDMGQPVLIKQLAERLIQLSDVNDKNIKIVFTGLLPGEKLHEILSSKEEPLKNSQFEKIKISDQRNSFWQLDTLNANLSALENALKNYPNFDLKQLIFNLTAR